MSSRPRWKRRPGTSLPARGAWIEIQQWALDVAGVGRSPHGERGLKSLACKGIAEVPPSLPARGAWIEMMKERFEAYKLASLPARGAWIEI